MVSHKSSRTSVRLAPQAIISNVRLSAANSDSTCLWSMTCIATSPVVICLMASGPRDNSVVLMMAAPPRIDTQAVDGLSSTFSFTTARLPEYCSAIASTVGDIIRQGAHQAAQKSTSTGFSDFRTSCSKELSVTSLTLSFIFVVPSYFACLLEMLENFYA